MPNPGIDFDILVQKNLIEINNPSSVNELEVQKCISSVLKKSPKTEEDKVKSLLKAVTHIDLTSLTGEETSSEIEKLCLKAENPIPKESLRKLTSNPSDVKCAAVCVYPEFAADCIRILKSVGSKVLVAAVAGDFHLGILPLNEKLAEVDTVMASGATEVDVVINKKFVLKEDWKGLYNEVWEMKNRCLEGTHMKVIIKSGELESLANIYAASIVVMAAGADFIKTSTGKEAVNATLPVGVVMAQAIKRYYEETGFKVGFKPAGGIKKAEEAIHWLTVMEHELGSDWMNPCLFRIGASSLLGDIENYVCNF